MMNKILYSFVLLAAFAVGGDCYARGNTWLIVDTATTRVSETTASGLSITVNYAPATLSGRTIGKEVAPFGQVWSTGGGGVTTFEINRDAIVEGKALTAGKYRLCSVPGEEWTIVFNKILAPAAKYSEANDALRVTVRSGRIENLVEKMTFLISKEGVINLWWGHTEVRFMVQ